MQKTIAVVSGDGIGPEIVHEGVETLKKVAQKYGHTFEFDYVLAGGRAIDETGSPLPDDTILRCKRAHSVLLGAVGGPKWEALPGDKRPERALLGLRHALGLYANIRPSTLIPSLKEACPLRADIVDKGLDLVVVRELIGGIYFGDRGRTVSQKGEKAAFDTLFYTEDEIERVARVAFDLAMKRRKRLTSVDKANVLESSRLWREVLHRVKGDYPEVEYGDMLVDNCAMQLIRNPSQFDVIVTENMFGDILSDETSMLTGSIGMIPSASLGGSQAGLYEPIHGSAPDIAGQNRANPIATILSCAMMLKYSFGMVAEGEEIERAVSLTLEQGYATGDIMSPGKTLLTCSEMGETVRRNIG